MGIVKKTIKDEARVLETTDISGMNVSNIFNEQNQCQNIASITHE